MCGAKADGAAIPANVDPSKEAIIQGTVTRGGEGVGQAYVRLLDSSGEFTAEVPTSATGEFRFFARSGEWTLRVLAPGGVTQDRAVVAETGSIAEVEVQLPA
jgi:hypothetical protein